MPAAVRMRTDFSANELRRLAATTKNANQSRRLLSRAAVLDGMNRTEAACEAWRRLIAQPHIITSIGSREWALTGQR